MVSITNAVRPICLVVHVVLVCLFIRILIPGLIPLGPSVAESAIHHSDSSEAAVQAAPNAPPPPPPRGSAITAEAFIPWAIHLRLHHLRPAPQPSDHTGKGVGNGLPHKPVPHCPAIRAGP